MTTDIEYIVIEAPGLGLSHTERADLTWYIESRARAAYPGVPVAVTTLHYTRHPRVVAVASDEAEDPDRRSAEVVSRLTAFVRSAAAGDIWRGE